MFSACFRLRMRFAKSSHALITSNRLLLPVVKGLPFITLQRQAHHEPGIDEDCAEDNHDEGGDAANHDPTGKLGVGFPGLRAAEMVAPEAFEDFEHRFVGGFVGVIPLRVQRTQY